MEHNSPGWLGAVACLLAISVTACHDPSPTAPESDSFDIGRAGEVMLGRIPELPAASPASLASVYSVTPTWPAPGSTLTGTIPRSSSLMVRGDDRIISRLRIAGLTPGHVYNVHFVYFNHPEHCTNGGPRYSPPARCDAFGPTDMGDGAIPETEFSVVNYPGILAGPSGMAVFTHRLGEDPPSEVVTGPGLTNPLEAQVFANIEDKGPELPAGPGRDLQYNTLRGGCTGPPFFGSYACVIVGNSLIR